MALKECGEFTIDTETCQVTGPESYMLERGNAHLRGIEQGRDVVVNSGYSPDIYTAILVSLQTDYAGWRGQKQMEGWLERKEQNPALQALRRNVTGKVESGESESITERRS